jgi:hypothetical protein
MEGHLLTFALILIALVTLMFSIIRSGRLPG